MYAYIITMEILDNSQREEEGGERERERERKRERERERKRERERIHVGWYGTKPTKCVGLIYFSNLVCLEYFKNF